MTAGSVSAVIIKYALISSSVVVGLYAMFIGLLTTNSFQTHVIYLHKIQMTWFQDLNTPEAFGFLHNQVTPFGIQSSSGDTLFAWHIVPIELYRNNEQILLQEQPGYS